jgi:hypothetical protein
MKGGYRTRESARTRLGVALTLVVLASAVTLAVFLVGVGPGTAAGTVQQNVSGPPELHSGEKINHTAVELLFVDDTGVETGSIDRDDFLLTEGSLRSLSARSNGTNATVVLRLDSALDTDELTVGVRPGSDIQDLDGNEIETSDGPPSVTITGMDGVPPRPLGTNVTDARGRPAHIEFNFDEPLQELFVEIDGPASTVLTMADFENPSGARYVAEYDPPEDGDYEVVLVNATDIANNTRDLGIYRDITANRTTPRTVIGLDFAASEGLNITFDASQSDDSAVNFTWQFGDGTTATGEHVTHEFDPGIYTVTLTARDGHGNVGRDQVELNLTDGVDVVVPNGDDNTNETPRVTIDKSGLGSDAIITVLEARGGRPVRIGAVYGADEPLLAHESVTLDGLTVTTTENVSYRLALSASGPGSVADAERDGTEAIGGLTVINDVADSQVETAEFTFSVDTNRLTALGIEPENVTLRREHDGAWQPLETTVVSRTTETIRFEATAPGFSRFAVLGTSSEQTGDDSETDDDETGDRSDDGTDETEPAPTVTGVELNETTIDAGAAVEITATVENQGNGTADFLAGLGMDGQLLETQTVAAIPSGETATATFVRQFDDPGTYMLAVNGTEAEPLTVEQQDEQSSEGDSNDQNTGGDDSDGEESDDSQDDSGDGSSDTGDSGQASSDTGNFNVTEVTVNTTEIAPNGTVQITANIKNQGEETGDFTAGLEIDGELVTVQPVPKIPSNTSIPAKFERQFEEPGTYNVSVNGTVGQQPISVKESGGGGGGLLGFLPLGFLPLGLLRTVFLFLGAPVLTVYLALKGVAFYMGY